VKSRPTALLLGAAGLILAVAMIWPWISAAYPAVGPDLPVRASPPETPAVSGVDLRGEAIGEVRVPLTSAAEIPRSFDDFLERLVDLGSQLTLAVQARDQDLAQELDRLSRDELEELYRYFPAPEARALSRLAGLPPDDASVPALVRRKVCLLLLTRGLQQRYEQERATGSRRRLDTLVSAMLATVPQAERLAQELGGQLVDHPYLGLVHEEAVLDLVAMTSEQPFLAELSTALLLTLWDNLSASGARTSSELASLALLFKDDANPSRRLAAFIHLLKAEQGRYRDVVLDEVCRRRERDLARELGMAAARTLEPPEALGVLRRLVTVSRDESMGAFLTLGRRDPELLRETYEELLADNVEPGLRAELVTGTGFSAMPAGIELARLAFQSDPLPKVRIRAMLVITSKASQAWGEETVGSALDDPAFATDPQNLGAIVWALDNLARSGMVNAVHRLGTRLMSRSELLPGDREQLADLLSRSLPGGRIK
jgi:hypothetical protein